MMTTADVVPEKVENISPIQDVYMGKYFADNEQNLTSTLDCAGHTRMKMRRYIVYHEDFIKIKQIKTRIFL